MKSLKGLFQQTTELKGSMETPSFPPPLPAACQLLSCRLGFFFLKKNLAFVYTKLGYGGGKLASSLAGEASPVGNEVIN